jgi:hypothetical protein
MCEQLHTGTECQRAFLKTFCISVEGKAIGLLCEYGVPEQRNQVARAA